MKIFKNKLGLICIEPEDGYLLRRNHQTFKKALLGINDKPEFYEEVPDDEYIKTEAEEEVEDKIEKESLYILTSPNGKRFKLVVSDDGELKTEEIK